MPPRTRYPLDALLRRRQELQDEKARSLAERVRASAAAEQRQRNAEAAERQQRETIEKTVQLESERADRGSATVQDLLTMQAWEIAQRARAAQLHQQAEQAAEQTQQARSRETAARVDLANAQAQTDVVARDKEKHLARVRREEQARADEDAEEAHGARAFQRRTTRKEER